MSPTAERKGCDRTERLFEYVLQTLPPEEIPAVEAHLAACTECQHEIEALRPVVDSFVSWPTDVLRPSTPLWGRLAERIQAETGEEPAALSPGGWVEPEWEEVAPGISCKLLATDEERERVSMLVRLAPGVAYPPHRHAGVEELHLLDGELMINDRKLHPGDYNRAEVGTNDKLVWSRTGCTCVLVTSTRDVLG
jgi:anti-sigma factor ChrR (cupin superfamily)